MDITFDNIIISKPRKIENTYICPIFYNQKKENLQITFTNMVIIDIKPLKNRNEFVLYCKNKNYNNFLFDLSTFIINQVKEKSVIWFKNDHLIDLIDDYYTSPLLYDKNHGDIIKFKCIGDENYIKDYIGKKTDIDIQFTQLKFYKQKFLLEAEVIKLQEAINKYDILENHEDDDENNEFEESPEPDLEDINYIKKEHIDISDKYLNELKTMLSEIESKIKDLENIKIKLLNTNNIENIIPICDDLTKLCE
jgi:hypothetical protein